jgi:hypothetical protein
MCAAKLHAELLNLLHQHCRYRGLRHLLTLGWMVLGLSGSGTVQLTAWEADVSDRTQRAYSYQRRWSRFLSNLKISPTSQIRFIDHSEITAPAHQ